MSAAPSPSSRGVFERLASRSPAPLARLALRIQALYRSTYWLVETRRTYAGASRARAAADVLRTAVAPRRTILCYPEQPQTYSVLYRLCAVSGYKITGNPSGRYDAAFFWEAATRSDAEPFENEAAAINRLCTDISKQRVGLVFESVFGYQLRVDPTRYEGVVVKKSDKNSTHDGEIIECPISEADIDPGYVYQKAIDNRREGEESFYEYRVPIFGPTIPVVYLKSRPADAQFKAFDGAEVVEPSEVLSREERDQLLMFAREFEMDYGELDVLRDRSDGRIYVVDANKTPSGPQAGFRPEQQGPALQSLRPAFEALLTEAGRRLAAESPGPQV